MRMQIDSVYNYCIRNGIRMDVFDDRKFRAAKTPYKNVVSYESGNEEYYERCVLPMYSAQMKDVCIYGESDAITIEDNYLTDKYVWDKEGLQFFYPWFVKKIDISDNYAIIEDEYTESVEIDKGICLVKMWPSNYFHFTAEVLGKLVQISQKEEYKDYSLLIDEVTANDPKNSELREIIDEFDREVIYIKTKNKYTVRDMVYLSYGTWISQSSIELQKGESTIYDSRMLNYVRNRVLDYYGFSDVYAEKVYIARGNDIRLVNESYLIDHLKGLGFAIINPDNCSLKDEIGYYYTARILIGCAGAAFTNMIYANPAAYYYQICPMELQYASNGGREIAKSVGVNLNMINAEIVDYGINMNKSSFKIDIAHLDDIISDRIK